jgi:hypothetical protein
MLNQDQPGLLEREREEIFLHGALDALRSLNGEAPQAIFITGPAGSGRSTLLAWLAREARRSIRLATFAFRWPQNESGLTALETVLSADETSPLYPYLDSYREQVARLRELEEQVEQAQLSLGIPDLKKLAWGQAVDLERFRTVQALPPPALHFLLRKIFTVNVSNQLSEQSAAFIKTGLEHIIQLNANNLGQLRAFVEEELHPQISQEDWQFYLRPNESLARELALGLDGYLEKKERSLVLLFDDYHPSEDDRYLRPVIENCKNTLWVFACPQPPVWAEKLSRFAILRLDELSQSGIATYFEKQHGRALSDEETSWLTGLSGGNPLLLGIASALYAQGKSAAELDAVASRASDNKAGSLFLYFVEESGLLSDQERRQLYALALLYKPTPDFLEAFGQAVNEAGYYFDPALLDQLFEKYSWLAEQIESVDDAQVRQLHPALKETLRRYLMLERRRFSQPVQEGILEPARNVAVTGVENAEQALVDEPEEQGSVRARARDKQWGEAVAALAYYRLWLDEAVGWVFLLPRWMMAFAYNRPLARQLVALAESMEPTFYNEGVDLLPVLRTLLKDSYTMGGKSLTEKFEALEKLGQVGVEGRGRWFKAENLGMRPAGKGSAEAELRGLLRWEQARVYEEVGQYEKAAPLYEEVLATNVEMPELKKAASRTALYLALRYRLRQANESAYSALYRAAELNDRQLDGLYALFWQSLKMQHYDTALKVADTLTDLGIKQGNLLMVFALYALDRKAESLTEARSYAALPASENAGARSELLALVRYAGLPDDTAELLEILNELPE